MKRREFVFGLGASTVGGTTILGSGAYTSVEAERSVSINVAADTDALLALVPTTEYATTRSGELVLDLSPANPTGAGGQGVNANAETIINTAFKVENRGTQTVSPFFRTSSDGDPVTTVTLTSVDEGLEVVIMPTAGTRPPLLLEPGEALSYDIEVFAGAGATSDSSIDETVTIVGQAVDG